jgi:nucleoside-diphosphate-sugar epimerase
LKKILLIGGSGFLGKELALKLSKSYIVTATKRKVNLKKINKNLNYLQLDCTNFTQCKKIIRNYDIVINSAAILNGKNPNEDFKINLIIFLFSYIASIKNNIKNYYFISSNSIYEKIIYKTKIKNNIYSYNFYKIICELIGLRLSPKFNLKFSILRLANLYGPQMKNGFILDIIKKFRKKDKIIKIYGNKKTSRNFCYIDDAVNCINFLIKKDFSGQINITNSKRINIVDIVNEISIFFDKKYIFTSKNKEPKNIRLFDTKKLTAIGWNDKFSFKKGLVKTLNSFK